MNAEIVARLQASFDADGSPAPSEQSETARTDWAERFHLYRIEAQLDAVTTQLSLATMQARMLDDKLDQLASSTGNEVQKRTLQVEWEEAKNLCKSLEKRRAEVLAVLRVQQQRADDASRAELRVINAAIDKSIQDELMAVHAMEEKLGIPKEQRNVVSNADSPPPTKKPASKKTP